MIQGIDISHHNGKINWDKLPEFIEFVGVKCTQGTGYLDPKYKENISNARKKGKAILHYHYAEGITPIKEVEWFYKNADIREGECIALDFEVRTPGQVIFCEDFIKQSITKFRFTPFFYSYVSIIKLFKTGLPEICGLWIADPSGKPRTGAWKTWAIWQHTISPAGTISGISTSVDMDYFNGTIEQFKKYGLQSVLSHDEVIPVQVTNLTPKTSEIASGESTTPNPTPSETSTTANLIADPYKLVENAEPYIGEYKEAKSFLSILWDYIQMLWKK